MPAVLRWVALSSACWRPRTHCLFIFGLISKEHFFVLSQRKNNQAHGAAHDLERGGRRGARQRATQRPDMASVWHASTRSSFSTLPKPDWKHPGTTLAPLQFRVPWRDDVFKRSWRSWVNTRADLAPARQLLTLCTRTVVLRRGSYELPCCFNCSSRRCSLFLRVAMVRRRF